MARARNRVFEGYAELHHVVPRCLGGTDDPSNLVSLTAGEHYVAHQLLVKMHPDHKGLAYAAVCMTMKGKGNRLYGWLRARHAENARSLMMGNKHAVGRKLSAKHMAAVSKPKTEEHKLKIGLANSGKTKGIPRGPQSEEHKRKRGEARAKAWAEWRARRAQGAENH